MEKEGDLGRGTGLVIADGCSDIYGYHSAGSRFDFSSAADADCRSDGDRRGVEYGEAGWGCGATAAFSGKLAVESCRGSSPPIGFRHSRGLSSVPLLTSSA